MKIFELYFNPKEKNKISESFQYKPKDAYEGKLGRIYMVGEVTDPKENDRSFLQNAFHIIKESYYQDASLSPEKALKKTLREVNNFVREREYDGKLNIALISSKNFSIYLSKIGRIKVLLVSGGKTKNIGEDMERGKSNLFYNMVSGKMKKSDHLVVLTPEIYDFFKKGKIIDEIEKNTSTEKVMERISLLQKEKFPHSSGIALVMDHGVSLKEKEIKIINKDRKEKFSFKELFSKTFSSLSKINIGSFWKKIPSIKVKKPVIEKKPLLLFSLLFGVIFLGFLSIRIEKNIRLNKEREQLALIEEKITHGKETNDFFLMEEALFDLESIIKKKKAVESEARDMYISLKEELFALSSREEVEELKFIGKTEEINPDQISLINGKIYLFSSSSSKMVILDPEKEEDTSYKLPLEEGVALSSSNGLMLFSPPNTLAFIEKEDSISTKKINLLEENQEFVSLSSFLGTPYFLDSQGRIIRYSGKEPTEWIKEQEELIEEGISIAIDGSIFALTSENKIYRYHKGEKKESVNYSIFPSPKAKTKVYTSPEEPLFLLESEEKRITILNKNGEIVTQLFNEEFKNLKDIALTEEEKIYLLLGKEVYLLEL